MLISAYNDGETDWISVALDIVYIHGLQIETVIGIWDWERRVKQTVVVDLDLGTDIAAAGASDSMEDTIDYKAVAKRIIEFAQAEQFLLVEALAEQSAKILMEEFAVKWVRIRINKRGALRGVRDVGVVIERSSKVDG